MVKVKIAMVGPKQSGKTRLSNSLARKQFTSEEYDPTAGCRILELTREVHGSGMKTSMADIELWDCSGDQTYENCWPAIAKDVHGVVVVFDPRSQQQSDDVQMWCEWFAAAAKLEDKQIVVFAHGNMKNKHNPLVVKAEDGRKVSCAIVNASTDKDASTNETTADEEFDQFVSQLLPYAK